MNIYPSILTGSLREAQEQLDAFQDDSQVDIVQVDVIDGIFADNLTITPADVAELQTGDLTIDLHLMVEEPMDYVYEVIDYKDQLPIRAIIAQIEKMSDFDEYVSLLKKHNYSVGISFDYFTPLEALDDHIWEKLDVVQLMAIEAGAQGKSLKTGIYDKLKALNELIEQFDVTVEVIIDGGVKLDNIDNLAAEGVDSCVVGSQIWESDDPQATAQQLKESAES